MIENLIIGNGFSALCSYLMLKKFNTKILHFTKINSNPNFLINRDNLNSNKLFSKRSNSLGNFKYKLHYNVKIHDRLISGGNTNIWGGFINIENIPDNYLKKFNQHSINFQKLNLETNGYKTNNSSIRQLRDKNDNILNSELFLKNCIHGFLHSFKVEKNKIILKIFDQKENNFTFLNTKKLILAISFPQLIDLLFRSKFLNDVKKFSLNEYNHKFIINFSKNLTKYNFNDCVIKYDFLRSLKHYLGYQKSLDKLKIPFPIYIDQIFYNNKKFIKLNLDFENNVISHSKKIKKFGDSIHYCNLFLDNISVNDYLIKISKNIIGTGMSFINQIKPGPISNDIMNDIYNKLR